MLDLDYVLKDPFYRDVYREGIKKGIKEFSPETTGAIVLGLQDKPLTQILKDVDNGEYDR